MLTNEVLKELLHEPELNNSERLLLCLAVTHETPKSVSEIKDIAKAAGWSKASSLNISDYLARTSGLAIRTDKGWELTKKGLDKVSELSGSRFSGVATKVATDLRAHLVSIKDGDTRAFVAEAISCYENHLYRAAVVLIWVGAVSVLYDVVITKHLIDFNSEAQRRDSRWKNAKTKDDLALMKESDFLQTLVAISVIGKSVKDELEGCLKLRNGCGHPNSLKVGDARVAGHIESLMQNVFAVF